jgi:hypothetical protein
MRPRQPPRAPSASPAAPALRLELRLGGRQIGAWDLQGEPLALIFRDSASGAELGRLRATGGPGPDDQGLDEAPVLPPLRRAADDDLTMPLPEPTGSLGALELETTGTTGGLSDKPTEEAAPPAWRGAVPNLAMLAARPPEDDLTLPGPEVDAPAAAGPADGPPPDEETWQDLTLHEDLDLDEPSGARGAPRPAPPAEVWVRRDDEWRPAGQLQPGRQATVQGAVVRLRPDGALQVDCGPQLAGTATLLDGQTLDLPPGRGARLPPGASVILRSGDHGLYVRSEPLPEATGEATSSGPRG